MRKFNTNFVISRRKTTAGSPFSKNYPSRFESSIEANRNKEKEENIRKGMYYFSFQ